MTDDERPLDFGGGEDAPPPEPRRSGGGGEPEPERRERLPGAGNGASRYGWIAAAAGILILVYITINTFGVAGSGPGSKGPKIGSPARPFAGPLAGGRLSGAVDVATKDGQGHAGKHAACSLHLAGAYNVCDAWKRGPVAVVFFADKSSRCVNELDDFQHASARHPGVGIVAVSIRGDRPGIVSKIAEHGWTFPVVYDEDGRLTNLYGVAVCPQVTYIRRGGIVAGTNIGDLSAATLDRQLTALERGAPPT